VQPADPVSGSTGNAALLSKTAGETGIRPFGKVSNGRSQDLNPGNARSTLCESARSQQQFRCPDPAQTAVPGRILFEELDQVAAFG